ncbi:MAG: copper resistance protein NlpE [Helicobacter sp.]|nr:copper resistance protein NlpE [Helicobacter sp.]
MKFLRIALLSMSLAFGSLAFGETSATSTASTNAGEIDPSVVGTYTANLPCADCSGVHAELTIKSDGTFERVDKYGEDDSGFAETGVIFAIDDLIVTKAENGDLVKYRRHGNDLILLDSDGSEPVGEFSDRYTFKLKAPKAIENENENENN